MAHPVSLALLVLGIGAPLDGGGIEVPSRPFDPARSPNPGAAHWMGCRSVAACSVPGARATAHLVGAGSTPATGGGLHWPHPGERFRRRWPESFCHCRSSVFLVFVALNRRLPGMPVLLVGLVLNLAVITLNGGWMPLSPETASHLPGGGPPETAPWARGSKTSRSCSSPEDTRLEFLADRFLLPTMGGYRAAMSLGDMFIAAGVFWLLARSPGTPHPQRRDNA